MKKRATKPVSPDTVASVEKAKPDWLPLHVAKLRFFPTCATEKTFPREIAELVKRSTSSAVDVAETDPYVVRIAFGGVGLVVDAAKGEIEIEADVVDDEWETIFGDFAGIRARIDHFPRVLDEGSIKHPFREAARLQHQLALQLIAAFRAGFRHAVATGGAEIFGRWRDLQSPFQPIHPDQWSRFAEAPDADWSQGTDVSTITADGGRGDLTVFSIHVCPHRKQESASNLARMQCTEFLMEKMKASPDARISRDTLELEARERWSEEKLSQRTFFACFAEAKMVVKPKGWYSRGPIKSLVQCTG
jgi:hypothetical protein